jgi:hypothetical protein
MSVCWDSYRRKYLVSVLLAEEQWGICCSRMVWWSIVRGLFLGWKLGSWFGRTGWLMFTLVRCRGAGNLAGLKSYGYQSFFFIKDQSGVELCVGLYCELLD